MKRVYFVTLIEILILFFVICYYVICTIKRHGNIIGESPFGEYGRNFFIKNSLLVNIISHCFMLILSFAILRFYCIPVFMDFHAALNGAYVETTGIVEKWSFSQENTNKLRIISIVDQNNEEINLKVYGYGVHKGETITVQYYEHSKYGRIKYN